MGKIEKQDLKPENFKKTKHLQKIIKLNASH